MSKKYRVRTQTKYVQIRKSADEEEKLMKEKNYQKILLRKNVHKKDTEEICGYERYYMDLRKEFTS